MMSKARAHVLGALAAALIVGACGGGGSDDDENADGDSPAAEESTTTPTEATTETSAAAESPTTAPLTPEEEVIRDYEEAVATASSLVNPPEPDSPLLEEHFTGNALERVRGSIRGIMTAGGAAENTIATHPRDVVITGDTATLNDCAIDRTQMLDLTNGRPVGEPGETYLDSAVQLERIDGVWKIARQTEIASPCTP